MSRSKSRSGPYTYTEIGTIAKHRHYTGGQWNPTDRLKSDDLGGGHAHSGLLCYQGGLWPKEYHGKLFMGNIHGHRLNVDEVKPKGSSYEGDRNPDFLLSHDKTCIIVALQYAPDGNVYFSDWSDKQVCHTGNVEIWDRTNGRVFKIVHKDTKPVKGLDLQKLSDAELVKLQTSDNEWMVRHARRILQERFAAPARTAIEDVDAALAKQKAITMKALEELAEDDKNPVVRLRAVWALHAADRFEMTGKQPSVFDDADAHVRGWVHQIIMERFSPTMDAKVGDSTPTASEIVRS